MSSEAEITSTTPTVVKDFRLATGAVAAWVAAAVGLGHRQWCDLWVLAAVAAIGLIALVAAARGGALAGATALSAFCVVAVMAPLAARLHTASTSELATLAKARTRVVAELVVTSDPRLLSSKGGAGTARLAVSATVARVSIAGRLVDAGGAVLILADVSGWRDVLPGQRVRLDATLQPSSSDGLLRAVLAARAPPVLLGRPPWWQRAAGTIRASLRRACASLPPGPAGLLPGLVDGDTRDLDPVLDSRFRVAGLTHLVAVSGTNCAIVVGSVLLILRRRRTGPRMSAAIGLLVLVAFVVVARPSPSVLRAAFMAAVMLFGLATGRERDMVAALAATVLALLVWQPQLAVDTGFTMSVLATAALLLIAPGWAAALRRRRVPAGFAEALAVASAAHLVTAPVIAEVSGQVSLVAIPANILAEPVVGVTTILGFLAAVLAPVNLAAGTALAQAAGIGCRWLIAVADYFGGLDGATIPWPRGQVGGLALLAVLLTLARLASHAGPRRVMVVAGVVMLIVQIPVRSVTSGWPARGWIFVACDVGQGDGLVLPAGPHSAVVVDAGPDPVAMSRCLDDLGITDVALLVFSHYHLDHVGGVAGVFRGRTVHQVLTGPLNLPVSGLDLVASTLRAHGLAIGQAPVGSAVQVGSVRLEYLAPTAAFRGTRSDPNNSSLIIRATVGGRTIMLAGDAEVDAQQSMIMSGADLRADVLKVPHHGSTWWCQVPVLR
jgi:competence protein ComEC